MKYINRCTLSSALVAVRRTSVLDEAGDIAGMIEMGVGQGDGVDPRGIDSETGPVAGADVAPALEHAAIEQDLLLIMLDKIARSGNLTGST